MISEQIKRSKTLKKNVIKSTFYKAINLVFTFILIRITIDFAGEEKYGIWVTILSFLTWFSAIEVGISNGIRNQITTYFSEERFDRIRTIVAQVFNNLTKVYLSLIGILTSLLFLTPLEQLFIPSESNYPSIKWALVVCISFYFLHFVFYFLSSILLSIHRASSTYKIVAIQNGITLIGILILTHFIDHPSILLICFWFSIVPFLVWAIANLILFKFSLKALEPNFSSNLKSKKITSNNLSFFIIQLCVLIIFSTDNLIIINILNGTEVTNYHIAFKYFNIITVIFNLILLPHWASFAEAIHKKDNHWIKNNIKKLLFIWSGLLVTSFVMVLTSDMAYQIWIGNSINIPIELSIFTAIAALMTAWYNIFAYFLNSVNKIRTQRNWIIFSASINIPLSIYLTHLFGVQGVIVATCISLLPLCISLPLEYRKVMNQLHN